MSDQGAGHGADARSWLVRVGELFAGGPVDRQALTDSLRAAADRGLLGADELNIIIGAMHVAEMQARDIMIPVAQVVTLDVTLSLDALLPIIVGSRHSRFPVIGDDIDDVRGILHAKDLLGLAQGERNDFSIKDCIRPAIKIPESKRLNVLLQEFRNNRNHMAVVVDEYGNTAGVVTIENVLEQIVGEIEDEYDLLDDSHIKRIDPRSFTVKAITPIAEFNARFGTALPDEEFDTIGGVVLSRFGHLPKRDECVVIAQIDFKVLSADGRRIRLLQVTPPIDVA